MSQDEVLLSVDAPYRVAVGTSIPVGIGVVNASASPISIIVCDVTASYDIDTKVSETCNAIDPRHEWETIQIAPHQRWYSIVTIRPPSESTGIARLGGELTYRAHRKGFGTGANLDSISQTTVSWQLETQVSTAVGVPAHPGWYAGDFYYSWLSCPSSYMGAPAEVIAKLGESLGLSWSCVLFSSEPPVAPQVGHERWEELRNEILHVGQRQVLVPAQITTCHCSDRKTASVFIVGADDLVACGSDLQQVLLKIQDKAYLGYAIGPFHRKNERLSKLLSGLLSRQKRWQPRDLALSGLSGLKLWNGRFCERDAGYEQFHLGITAWTRLLLSGEKKTLLGGSDALASAVFRAGKQVHCSPVLLEHPEHLFAMIRTHVYCPDGLSADCLLDALRYGRVVVSEGPIVTFSLSNKIGETAQIGDSLRGESLKIAIQAISSEEYGDFQVVFVVRGDFVEQTEEIELTLIRGKGVSQDMKNISVEEELAIPVGSHGYLRIEAYTERDGKAFYVFTNPIWIDVER